MDINFDITEEELPIFRAEADEQLQVLEEGLVRLEKESENQDLVQAIFRAAHTLKGSAGMIGHKRMVELTHALETVLDGVRKDTLSITPSMIDICLESLDSLHQLCDEVILKKSSDIDSTPLVKQLIALASEQTEPSLLGNSNLTVTTSSKPGISDKTAALTWTEDITVNNTNSSNSLHLRAQISADSIASSARAFQIILALQETGKILNMEPSLVDIEAAKPVSTYTAVFVPTKPITEVRKALMMISEIDELILGEERLIGGVSAESVEAQSDTAKTDANVQAPRLPLGEILLAKGLISKSQLETALIYQRNSQGPASTLGQALVNLGAVSQEVLDEIISEQSKQKKTSQIEAEAAERAQAVESGKGKTIEKTVRTSVERLDTLMNLIGELITDRNRMYQLRRDLETQYRGSTQVEAISETITHVGRITDMLQSEVMSIRMLPISNVFNKFPRLVRDLSRKAGKQIDLVIRGEDTELDRSVIEVISDPLIHLVRNSVDHGIEKPEKRNATGKPERGIILLTAKHEQGRIHITIEDNGSGIDLERVKNKAVEKGHLTRAEADALTDDEAVDLIFVSGLSTAKIVSDVSGRGVGMDIVRNNIERLNGNILVETYPGKGTLFTIVLPLTLAIVPTLLVRVGEATYAIPLVTVNETLRIKAEDIQTVNAKPVIILREHVLPVARLTEIFGMTNPNNSNVQSDHEYVVVVRSGKSQLGLIVDSLIGEEEVVVKSLSTVVGEVIGVSSAAILGDGQVALILDVQGLIRLATSLQEKP